jgi:twitching motility two-component system response regulator PilG
MESSCTANLPNATVFNHYEADRLSSILTALITPNFNTYVQLETKLHGVQHSIVVTFHQGRISFCSAEIPTTADVLATIAQGQAAAWAEQLKQLSGGFSVATCSPKKLISSCMTLGLASWPDLQKTLLSSIVIALEPFWHAPGQFRILAAHTIDQVDFEWEQVQSLLRQRMALWDALKPPIPSMTSIPLLGANFPATPDADHPNLELSQTVNQWVDQTSDFIAIGKRLAMDPLRVARTLLPAFENQWLTTQLSATPESAQKTGRSTILAVDDSELMRQLIIRVLGPHYRVLLAETAMEALNLLKTNPVDLMLLDVSMPGIDGLELCKTIRHLPGYRAFPIIMVTSRDGFFDRVKGRMAGATEYLTKPFDHHELLKLVATHLLVEHKVYGT